MFRKGGKMNPGDQFNPYKLFVGSFIPNALLRYKGLSFGAKLTYARLSQYAGQDGQCFPKQETLADELGSSLSAIKRFIKELVDKQFINKKIPNGQDRFMHKTIRYSFLWHDCFKENFSPQPKTDLSAQPKTGQPKTDLSTQSETELSAQPKTDLSNLRESKKRESKKEKKRESVPKSKILFSTNKDKSPSPPLRGTPPPQISGSVSNIPSNNKISKTNSNIPDQSQTPRKPEINPCSEGDSNISQTTISNFSNNTIGLEIAGIFSKTREKKLSIPPPSDKEFQSWVIILGGITNENNKQDVIKAIEFVMTDTKDWKAHRIIEPRTFKDNLTLLITRSQEQKRKRRTHKSTSEGFIPR